jgi:small-conductance mechanosensitive channel
VLAPISFERVEKALSTPSGWVELALVLLCFAAGWAVDRAIVARKREGVVPSSLAKGAFRIVMPVVALVLLYFGRAFWRSYGTPLFFNAGVVLALALAAIRILVYALRRLVPNAHWLKSSERTVSLVVWALVALHVLGVTPEIAAELDAIRLPIGRAELSLLKIATGIVAVLFTIAATLWVAGLIESRLMKTDLDLSHKALASKFIKAALVVIGVLIALQTIGLDLTVLSVFGGALGVGIGLGLQKLASNYIAGFVILLERSIRLGDLVTVSDRYGAVTKVTSRYVVVRSLDGVEAIVPNETMVTTTVLNHSLSARDARVAIQIQVAYGTDLERTLALLIQVARANPRVETADGRAPAAFVLRFADSGIDLELGVWIRDPENGQLNLRSDLNLAMWKAFQQEGIGVPFPQREVRIVGMPADSRPAPACRK